MGLLSPGPQAEKTALAAMVADSNMLPIGDKQTLLAILKFQGGFDGPQGHFIPEDATGGPV
jgi:hypothetical protein